MTTKELRELDDWIGTAIGDLPTVRWIVTSDGGQSARISFDAEWQVDDWFRRYAETLAKGCVKSSWSFWREYSSNPAASDALLDKMTELGWMYSIALGGSGRVSVLFHRHDGENMPYGTATDGDRHLAIALAAKAALESTQSGKTEERQS